MVVTEQTDTALEQAIIKAICADQNLSGKEINVQVKKQAVILKGKVGSLAELSRAEKLASVDGVINVDSSLIAISDGRTENTRDKAIFHEAEQALMRHPVLRESQVQVEVNQGKATLSGTAKTLKQKLEAHRIISEIRGVVTILNLIETPEADNAAGERSDGVD